MMEWTLSIDVPNHDHQRVLCFTHPDADLRVLVTVRGSEWPLLTYQWRHQGGWETEDARYPERIEHDSDGDPVYGFDVWDTGEPWLLLWAYRHHTPQLTSHAPEDASLHLDRVAALARQDAWAGRP